MIVENLLENPKLMLVTVFFYEDSGNGLLTHHDILGGIRDYKSITV